MQIIGDWLGRVFCMSRDAQKVLVLDSSSGSQTEGAGESKMGAKSAVLSKEWLYLASVLDRTFFICFSFIYIVMAMACLI